MEKREDKGNEGGVLFRGHAGCGEAVGIAVEGAAAHCVNEVLHLKDRREVVGEFWGAVWRC